MSFEEIILVSIGGILVGFVGGYAGIGAAPILVFVYGYFLGYPQHTAQGTVAAIMLGPMSAGGVIAMWERVWKYRITVLIGVVTYAVFSYPGAVLAYFFSNLTLRLIFAAFLVFLGIRTAFGEYRNNPDNISVSPGRGVSIPLNHFSVVVLGAIIGLVGGFLGIGAGVLMVPLLIWLFRVSKNDARAISLAILLPPVSIGAVWKYHSEGDVNWWAVLVGLLAYMTSNYFGARFGSRQSDRAFNYFLAVLMVVIGIVYSLACFSL